jgi:hypothetical protein
VAVPPAEHGGVRIDRFGPTTEPFLSNSSTRKPSPLPTMAKCISASGTAPENSTAKPSTSAYHWVERSRSLTVDPTWWNFISSGFCLVVMKVLLGLSSQRSEERVGDSYRTVYSVDGARLSHEVHHAGV